MDLQTVHFVSGDVPTKLIRNLTDRGLIKIKNRNPGTNQKRLYSLQNAIEIWCMWHFMNEGRTGPVARILTDKIVGYAQRVFLPGVTIDDLLMSGRVMVYKGVPGESGFEAAACEPSEIPKWIETPNQTSLTDLLRGTPMSFYIFHIDYLLQRCTEAYLDQIETLSRTENE